LGGRIVKRVAYIFPTLHHYRMPFHRRLRTLLAAKNVDYHVVYCRPGGENLLKQDAVEIEWGTCVGRTALFGKLLYQQALAEAWKSDLVIVQQENKLALNYLLNFLSTVGLKKVAFFGHGRNFQSRRPDGLAERWKRLWATRVDWWFAYTDQSRRHVEALGFPPERITVFNNAVDTGGLRAAADGLSEREAAQALAALGMRGGNVGIFVGGLYPDKRLEFLVDAAERVRALVPDFELLVVGGGSDMAKLQALAVSRPWLFVAGPRFGREKAALMRGAKLFLMPGLVGLAVLDAAAAALPVVTTAFPWHSPEFAYLEHGVSGVVVQDWQSADAYGGAVAELMLDDAGREALARGARAMASRYTIEAMAERFTTGVLAALEA